MDKNKILDYLLEKLAEYEDMSIQPTLKQIIRDLEKELEQEDLTHNAGHDDEWTEKVVHDDGDFTGVTNEDR